MTELAQSPGPTGPIGTIVRDPVIKTPAPAPASGPTTIERGLRTAISAAVGFVVAFVVVHFGWHVSGTEQTQAVAALTAVGTAGYNAGVLYAEKRWPWTGWFLFNIGTPTK